MVDSVTEARKRQVARLDGVKPPTARRAMALAQSKAYQGRGGCRGDTAGLRDVANFHAWCTKHGFAAMPATPELVGAYLAAAGEGCAMPTLRRVAAIARGIGRKHGTPARRAAALTTAEVRKLCRACGAGIAGARDRALFLLGFAGAMRRSELIGLNVAEAAALRTVPPDRRASSSRLSGRYNEALNIGNEAAEAEGLLQEHRWIAHRPGVV